MTHLELVDGIKNRVGFKSELSDDFTPVVTGSGLSESTRYFQDEHTSLTLENIRNCQPNSELDSDDALFESYLVELKRQNALKVVHDVFKQVDVIKDGILQRFPTIFDEALSLRMVIHVSEIILNSTRTNNVQRIVDMKSTLFRDINGVKSDKSVGFHTSDIGIKARYSDELDSLKRQFSQQKRLKSITASDYPYNYNQIKYNDLQ